MIVSNAIVNHEEGGYEVPCQLNICRNKIFSNQILIVFRESFEQKQFLWKISVSLLL